MNERCISAYQNIYSLHFEEATQLLITEQKAKPDNLLPQLLFTYLDALKIYINEQKPQHDRFLKTVEKRVKVLSDGPKSSPYHLFCLAEMNLMKAFARSKFEEYFTAFWEVRRAYKTLKQNQEKFPDFFPNLKSLGIIHAMVGTIPENYRWGVKILGMSGNVNDGIDQLETFMRESRANQNIFYEEAEVVYAFFLMYLKNDKEKTWELISDDYAHPDNPIKTFIAADLAFRMGKSDAGIEWLQQLQPSVKRHPFYFTDYFLGCLKLNRLDNDAGIHIEKYLNQFKGRHYVKEAWQRLGWFHLLKGDTLKFKFCQNQISQNGYTLVDADKRAQKEAEEGEIPHISLLKARLLFDGGYYLKTDLVLAQIDENDLRNEAEHLEFLYRKARVADNTGDKITAEKYYLKTIEKAQTTQLYFAPKSALLLGLIFEADGKKDEAAKWFNKCKTYKNYSYKNSLDQQAEAGLNRLK